MRKSTLVLPLLLCWTASASVRSLFFGYRHHSTTRDAKPLLLQKRPRTPLLLDPCSRIRAGSSTNDKGDADAEDDAANTFGTTATPRDDDVDDVATKQQQPAKPQEPLMILFDPDVNEGRPPQRAIVLLDGFCHYHGMYLASRAQQVPGTAVIPLLSRYLYDFFMASQPQDAVEHERLRLPETADELVVFRHQLDKINPDLEIVGVYCESDSGLANAETLRQALQVTCRDDPDQLEARRHKYQMQEWIRQHTDLSAVEQRLCDTADQAQAFAAELFANGHERVVVKPTRGVASESVHLCHNADQVTAACHAILGAAKFASRDRHEAVVVQEFLVGQEYAVDVVSRGGQHKVAAVWRYDKRPANGAAFCYFGTRLVDATMDPAVPAICDYVTTTLTALGIRYGLSHNEIIVTADRGPVLVEVNCRQHNMDFAPLTMACIGYNALDMTLVAMLGDDEDWEKFPDQPILRGHGLMVHVVNFVQGRLREVHHLDDMSKLDSFLDGEVYGNFLTPGEEIKPTVDIRSDAGWVQLINESEEQLLQDYRQIVDKMPTMFEVDASD